MYESKPRRREGEPIESLVGEAIKLTASRSGGGTGTGAADGEVGRGERDGGGRNLRAGSAAGARGGWTGAVPRLPWDGWDRDRLSAALLAAAGVATLEALVLVAILITTLF